MQGTKLNAITNILEPKGGLTLSHMMVDMSKGQDL